MFALRSVAVFLALFAYTQAEKCDQDFYGSHRGTEYPLLDVQFYEHEARVTLNAVPLPCPDEHVVGSWVKACSDDTRSPTVTFLGKFVADVTRNGQELGVVTVKSSVFCTPGVGLGSTMVGAPKVVAVGKN